MLTVAVDKSVLDDATSSARSLPSISRCLKGTLDLTTSPDKNKLKKYNCEST